MSEVSDAAVIASLRRQMAIAVARQVTAAANLANLDTPGYRAQEVDFDRALQDAGADLPLKTTSAAHVQTVSTRSVATRQDDLSPARRDGNNVQLDKELLSMTTAAEDFAKAQTVLAAKFKLVRYAINEGR